jgi:hypothetical protein
MTRLDHRAGPGGQLAAAWVPGRRPDTYVAAGDPVPRAESQPLLSVKDELADPRLA